MTRAITIGILAMALVVVASNILVQFLLGNWLTMGALTYPFAFLVTDLTNRLYGARAARIVVLAGFVVGIGCSLIASQMTGPEGYPLTTFRIAAGSGLAFLAAQLLDIGVFDRLRQGSWWRAPLVSSLVGSAVDTTLFFSIAFSAAFTFVDPSDNVSWAAETLPLLGFGPMVPLWVSLATADFCVKLTLALISLAPFRAGMRLLGRGRTA